MGVGDEFLVVPISETLGVLHMLINLPILLLAGVLAIAPGQVGDKSDGTKPAGEPTCGDHAVVEFILPGSFDKAQALAKKQNRCLIIKGVAGGMDRLGATQCTKGHW